MRGRLLALSAQAATFLGDLIMEDILCLSRCHLIWGREMDEIVSGVVLHAPLYLCGGDDGDGIG